MLNRVFSTKKVKVPQRLKGEKIEIIKEWAREELFGQESSLGMIACRAIRSGKLTEVELTPASPGFFTEDGKFIPTNDVNIRKNLEDVNNVMKRKDDDWAWADEENKKCNKTIFKQHGMIEIWQHGKRIDEFARSNGYMPNQVGKLLVERSTKDSYGLRSHETAVRFYRWRPNAQNDDPTFSLTWMIVDSILGFSHDNGIRNNVLDAVMRVINSSNWYGITVFIRGPNTRYAPWKADRDGKLLALRDKLKQGSRLNDNEVEELIKLLRR